VIVVDVRLLKFITPNPLPDVEKLNCDVATVPCVVEILASERVPLPTKVDITSARDGTAGVSVTDVDSDVAEFEELNAPNGTALVAVPTTARFALAACAVVAPVPPSETGCVFCSSLAILVVRDEI